MKIINLFSLMPVKLQIYKFLLKKIWLLKILIVLYLESKAVILEIVLFNNLFQQSSNVKKKFKKFLHYMILTVFIFLLEEKLSLKLYNTFAKKNIKIKHILDFAIIQSKENKMFLSIKLIFVIPHCL